MTLAELQAVVAFGAPETMPSLQSLLALVPLLAQRRRMSVAKVYAMQAGAFFDAGLDVLATLPADSIAEAQEAMRLAWLALDPERMQKRVPE